MQTFWRKVGIALFVGAGIFGLLGAIGAAILLSPFVG